MISGEEWRSELDKRRAQFRRIVDEHGCDATIVFGAHGHAEQFRYLTNFAPALGDAWLLTHGDAQPLCVLDFDWQVEEARRRSGIDEWRFALPVRPGDSLRYRGTVLESRLSASRPDRGIVKTVVEAVNTDGATVMRATAINFMLVRSGPGA